MVVMELVHLIFIAKSLDHKYNKKLVWDRYAAPQLEVRLAQMPPHICVY